MSTMGGALKSSTAEASSVRSPVFRALCRTAPWLSSVLWPSLRSEKPQRLLSWEAESSHFPAASEPSEAAGRNLRRMIDAEWPLLAWSNRGVREKGVSSKTHDLRALSNPEDINTGCPGRNSTLLTPV